MLAARTSNAFVCVRCELRLLRSSPSSLSRCPLRAQFSTSPARRGDALDEIERPAPEEQSQPRRKVSAHPLGRLHRHHGRAIVRASTAQLEGVKTLGKDAEILVLREVGDRQDQSAERQPDVVETPDDVDSPDILESIQGEGGPSTPQEVDEQLDSLRPKTHDDADEPHYITIEAYQSLTRTLNKSFTAQQLAHYLTSTKGSGGRPSKKQLVNQVLPAGKGKRPVERTPWFPGVTSSHRRLPGTDAHRGTKKNKSKPLMIDHILRTKWKVVTLEEIESSGEIEMRMNPWQLDLLTAGGMWNRFIERRAMLLTCTQTRLLLWIGSGTCAKRRFKPSRQIKCYALPLPRVVLNTLPTTSSGFSRAPKPSLYESTSG